MKFLCGNCKAKYQIPDEKVVGRTLRMKCRRCNHDILIDGHGMPGVAAAAPPARRQGGSSVSVIPGPQRGGSGVGPMPARPLPPVPASPRSKPPSPLGADFRRHAAAPPAVPARSAPYDLWHAAIQDVPVGPMTRDELARKIEAGAVTAQSLCWREGMDDWRPLGELAELAALLRRAGAPGAARPSSRPHAGRVPPAVPGPVGARSPSAYDYEEGEEEGSEPTRIADLTGGHPAAAPTPHRHPPAAVPPLAQAPAAAAVEAQAPAPAATPGQRSGMSSVALIALGLFFGIALFGLPLIIRQMWFPPQTPVAQAAVVPVEVQKTPTPVAPAAPVLEVPEQPDPKQDKVRPRPATRGTKTPSAAAPAPDKSKSNLSAAEQALLDRMGGGGEASLNGLGTKQAGGAGAASGPALNANQLMKVVQDNRPALQRCYETALRTTGGKSSDAIKVSVEVVVGMSGTVKSVGTVGTGLGNMNDCIKQSVKRWRFPASGDESPFNFPVVFQPGS